MRVLVLDEGFMSGTITARGLQRAGCAVDVIAAAGGRGACRTSGGQWRLAPAVGDPGLLCVIDDAVRRVPYDVVYPVTEPIQQLLWDEAPAWQEQVFPAVGDAQRGARRDKWRMSELVASHGVRIPAQRRIVADDLRDDVRAAAAAFGLPLVIKGSHGRGGQATVIAGSLAEAEMGARRLTDDGAQPFAQAFVRGVTHLVGGLFLHGRPLRLYAGAKTAQVPARTGPAAELFSVDDPALLRAAEQAAVAAQVSGLASMDFIRDDRGGYHFLELNPRPWGSINAAVAAGADLFAPLVALWRGGDVEPRLDYRVGLRSSVFPLYAMSSACWRDGRAARPLVADLHRALTLAQREPQLAGHMMHRVLRVGLAWRHHLTSHSVESSCP